MAKLAIHLLGHSRRDTHRSDPTRLGDPDFAKSSVAYLVKILRNLCGLARASLSDDYENLVVSYRSQKFVSEVKHRQTFPLLFDQ